MTGFLCIFSILVTVLNITEGFKTLPSNVLKPRSNVALDGSRDKLFNALISTSIGIATLFSPFTVLAEETVPIVAATIKVEAEAAPIEPIIVKVEKEVEKVVAKDTSFRGFIAAMEAKQLTKVIRSFLECIETRLWFRIYASIG